MILKPLEKRPLYREEIKNNILDLILNGELKPGDRIIETQWAKVMGVSQAPVREALHELVLLGIVKSIPYKGTFVCGLTYREMLEAYNIREMLEHYAVDAVIKNITENQIKEAEQLLNWMREAANCNDRNEYISLNATFHQLFINASASPLLIRLWTQCNINETTRISTVNSKFTLQELAERHVPIFKAYKEHDVKAAHAAILKHFGLLKNELAKNVIETIHSHEED
jgi:DNA-binding GntR family transcriptional regulator